MKDLLNNCEDRFQLWSEFIKAKNVETIAEVGVYKGDFAAFTLEKCSKIKTYIMIDPWRNLSDWNKPANTVDDEFESYFNETKQRTESFASKRKILRGKTTEVINKIEDNSLDFIYIDGDHTLKGISIDLINVWSKIKVGGYIAGDDFCPSIWQHAKNYEPSFVFPFAVYFAEAIGAKISALPFNQFLIEKVDTGFEFKDYTDKFYKNTSVLSQLSDLIGIEQDLKKRSFLPSFFKKEVMSDYSVVIRTKNSEKTIKDCLDSVFMQTIKPKEVVLVDSGSNDKTLEIVSNYSVVVIHYPKNIVFNYSKSLNIGISNLTGEYILILSSHVRLVSARAVELMLSVFSNHEKNISVSYWRTDKEGISEKKESVILDYVNINNFEGKAMFNFCSMIKKSSWTTKKFNEDLPTCEDQEWSYFYLKKGYRSVFIKEPKVFYKNYFYNYKKDVNETFTIGRVVYPKFISKKYMIDSIKKGYKNLKKRNIFLAKYYLLLSWYIFRFRVFGYYKNSSLYNKKLK